MVLPRVPEPATVPEAATSVVAGVVVRKESLVVLVRLAKAPEEVEGLPVRAGGHPEATDAAVGLGMTARRPALAVAKACLAEGQAVAGCAPVRQDEEAVKAKAWPATGTSPAAASAVLRPKKAVPPTRRRQAAADAGSATPILLRLKTATASPVAEAEGPEPPAVIADVLPCRVAAARAAPGLGRPGLVRPFAGQRTALARPVVVVATLVAISPTSLYLQYARPGIESKKEAI